MNFAVINIQVGTNAVWSVFSEEEEKKVVKYLRTLAFMKYGLTTIKTRIFLFKYAKVNQCCYPKSWDREQKAGKRWLLRFLKRHRELCMRKPEPTSLARCTGFNLATVGLFFDNLKKVLKEAGPNGIPPRRIFNLDETGVTTVQTPEKIIAPKGSKQAGQ